MKKVLYLLLIFPFMVQAQVPLRDQVDPEKTSIKEILMPTIPSQQYDPATMGDVEFYKSRARSKKVTVLPRDLVGLTFYDLQSNASTGRRVYAYANGEVSIVYTHSANPQSNFIDRGTGYNHYDGTKWVNNPQNITRVEGNRTGWPNIEVSDDGSYEFVISHLTDGTNNGGFVYSYNNAVGGTSWSHDLIDQFKGPIWFRSATSGKNVYVIGNYYDTSDYVGGVQRPLVYYKSTDNGKTWSVKNELIPGYADTSRFTFGTADNYSIDARDNYVVVVIGNRLRDLIMFKSDDYGVTFDRHIIQKHPNSIAQSRRDKLFDTITVNNGAVSVVLDDNGKAHVSWESLQIWNDDNTDDQVTYNLLANGIYYWKDEHTIDTFDVEDTTIIQLYAYNFLLNENNFIFGDAVDSFRYNTTTAWDYTYDTVTQMMDSTAQTPIWLYLFGNYNAGSVDIPFIATDSMLVWEPYYRYTFDTSGNKIDSMMIGPDNTLYLDSSLADIMVITSYTEIDTTYSYEPLLIGAALDGNGNGTLDYNIREGGSGAPTAKYNRAPLVMTPNIAVDLSNGNLFCVYSGAVEETFPIPNFPDFRDIYVVYSTDNGDSWAYPQNITKTAVDEVESVYPSVHTYIENNKLHLLYQEDDQPGVYAPDGTDHPATENEIYYMGVDVSKILNDEIGSGKGNVGIKEQTSFSGLSAWPNPFDGNINLDLELTSNKNVKVEIINTLGQVQKTVNLGMIPAGRKNINLNTSEIANGVYVIRVSSGDEISTLKVVKE